MTAAEAAHPELGKDQLAEVQAKIYPYVAKMAENTLPTTERKAVGFGMKVRGDIGNNAISELFTNLSLVKVEYEKAAGKGAEKAAKKAEMVTVNPFDFLNPVEFTGSKLYLYSRKLAGEAVQTRKVAEMAKLKQEGIALGDQTKLLLDKSIADDWRQCYHISNVLRKLRIQDLKPVKWAKEKFGVFPKLENAEWKEIEKKVVPEMQKLMVNCVPQNLEGGAKKEWIETQSKALMADIKKLLKGGDRTTFEGALEAALSARGNQAEWQYSSMVLRAGETMLTRAFIEGWQPGAIRKFFVGVQKNITPVRAVGAMIVISEGKRAGELVGKVVAGAKARKEEADAKAKAQAPAPVDSAKVAPADSQKVMQPKDIPKLNAEKRIEDYFKKRNDLVADQKEHITKLLEAWKNKDGSYAVIGKTDNEIEEYYRKNWDKKL